jgi:hypothetical protein
MRNVLITVGLGLLLIVPATASAAPAAHKAAKPARTHAATATTTTKHAKLKTPAKHTKRASADNKLMTPSWM